MASVRKVLGLLVLGTLLTLSALPALAHSGAQAPINSPTVNVPGDHGGDPNPVVN
jgi:hypothetical protein